MQNGFCWNIKGVPAEKFYKEYEKTSKKIVLKRTIFFIINKRKPVSYKNACSPLKHGVRSTGKIVCTGFLYMKVPVFSVPEFSVLILYLKS